MIRVAYKQLIADCIDKRNICKKKTKILINIILAVDMLIDINISAVKIIVIKDSPQMLKH